MKRKFYRLTTIIFAILTSVGQLCCIQQTVVNSTQHAFYLGYAFSGLGSNMGTFQPVLKVKDKKFIYTSEQTSSWFEQSIEKDTIKYGEFRQTSIDSIISLIKDLKDTTIFKTNPCVMSGGIHFLTVARDADTIKFELMNTFDYTALKIVNIINTYLPADKKILADEKLIKREEDCWEYIHKQSDKKKINNKTK